MVEPVVHAGERGSIKSTGRSCRIRTRCSASCGRRRRPGAELGRVEIGETIAAFLHRFPDAGLAVAPTDVEWRPSTFLRRVDSLPVALGPATQ